MPKKKKIITLEIQSSVIGATSTHVGAPQEKTNG